MATSSYFQICQWYYQIVFFKLASIIKFCSQTYQQYQILFSKLPVVLSNLSLKNCQWCYQILFSSLPVGLSNVMLKIASSIAEFYS